MKKIIPIILILLFSLTGCNNNEKKQENSYNVSRTSTEGNISSTNNENYNNSNTESNATDNTKTEIELSSFSTKIYTPDDEARQNNIRLTCSKLDGTIVKSGETFSFCNTVGKATPESGYKKADVFDKNGNTVKGYGGRKLSD